MILNIEGKNSPFQITRLELRQFKQYSIRLISIHGIISSYVNSGVYKITSNIIDREHGNSERVFGYVYLQRKTHVLEYEPVQSLWYKLRITDFSSLELKLTSVGTGEKLLFSEFCCQLEVQENERI